MSEVHPTESNRFERILERECEENSCVLAGKLAAASRSVRNSFEVPAGRVAIRDVAAGVLGPTLVSFSLWLLERAREQRLKTLFFLSRDGQVLHETIARIAGCLGMGIELKYMYSSRQAWVPGCITEINRKQLGWAFENTLFLSVRTQFNRLNLDPSTVQDVLIELGFPPEMWNENLVAGQRGRLQSALLEDSRLQEAIQKVIDESRELLLSYLKQENMLGTPDCALVDLGWYATTQRSLWRLFKEKAWLADDEADGICPAPLKGFYFALRGEMPATVAEGLDAEGFFLDEWHGRGMLDNDLPQLGAIMEAMFAADHGTLLRLQESGGRIVPILRTQTIPSLQEWGLDELRATIREIIDQCDLEGADLDGAACMRAVIHNLLKSFWFEPTHAEAEAWGCFPLGDKMGHIDEKVHMAESFSWRDIAGAWREGSIQLPYGCTWYHGCRTLTPKTKMLALTWAKHLSYVFKRVRRH